MKKVLIVDDHPDLRMLVRMTLELENFVIEEATSAVAAAAMLADFRPDLVLLDVMMPGEYDGLELCRRIKRDPSLKMRVILLTARGSAADCEAGRQAGADHFLVKPFSPRELLALVGSI